MEKTFVYFWFAGFTRKIDALRIGLDFDFNKYEALFQLLDIKIGSGVASVIEDWYNQFIKSFRATHMVSHSLYGWEMSHIPPISNIQELISPTTFDVMLNDIISIPNDFDYHCIAECVLKYPTEPKQNMENFPVCAENEMVKPEDFSLCMP